MIFQINKVGNKVSVINKTELLDIIIKNHDIFFIFAYDAVLIFLFKEKVRYSIN